MSVAKTISASRLLAAKPPAIIKTIVDFTKTPLPRYAGSYAVVLDNVLTPAECAEFLAVAETQGSWERAMINVGGGRQAMYTDVRNCGRIIWDDREVVDKLWQRVKPHVDEILTLKEKPRITGAWATKSGEVWQATRLNERMRFLKYVGGEYFKSHCDGIYQTPDGSEKSYFTLHLYLNDETVPAEGEDPLEGGATRFLAMDRWGDDDTTRAKYDVVPKLGRVLIFQHRDLLHSGDDVIKGTKYTLRTDMMYKLAKLE